MKYDFSVMIEKYKKNRISRREFLREIGIYILKYPQIHGFYDMDLRHEFYAAIASKLDKILLRYKKQENKTFFGWFNKVLKNQFISFLNRFYKEKSKYESVDSQFIEEDVAYEEPVAFSVELSGLTKNELEIISMKYGLNRTYDEIALRKIEKKKKLESRIAGKYVKLLKVQKQIKEENDPEKKKMLIEKERLLRESKRKLESRVKSMSLNPSNRVIADKLALKERTVSTYINRAKKKIETIGLENVIQ